MPKFDAFDINLRGRLLTIGRPQVVGILNATPDSFYAASRTESETSIAERVSQMMAEGADIIDIGACSTRLGSVAPTPAEEIDRLTIGLRAIRSISSEIPVSVDTYRADVARAAIDLGADIINDIGGGTLDPEMLPAVAQLRVPYVVTHMRGTPENMASHTDYTNVVTDVTFALSQRIFAMEEMGIADIIIDPGFGYAKTREQNYQLLSHLGHLHHVLRRPLMVGLSRKSMIRGVLGITPDEALNGTTVLHTVALLQGAAFLRVHDVKAAVEAVRLVDQLTNVQSIKP